MTQEDKQLLLTDLCGRLPYGVICYNSNTENNFKLCDIADVDSEYPTFDYGYGELETVKPYLRPMSSMTEEERKIYAKLLFADLGGVNEDFHKALDYLHSIHVDYRGLIPKRLAISTEEYNPYKE